MCPWGGWRIFAAQYIDDETLLDWFEKEHNDCNGDFGSADRFYKKICSYTNLISKPSKISADTFYLTLVNLNYLGNLGISAFIPTSQ